LLHCLFFRAEAEYLFEHVNGTIYVCVKIISKFGQKNKCLT